MRKEISLQPQWTPESKGTSFERFLYYRGYLTDSQIHLITYTKKQSHQPIEGLLMEMGLFSAQVLAELYEEWRGERPFCLSSLKPDPSLHHRFSRSLALDMMCLPLFEKDHTVHMAMVNIHDCLIQDRCRGCFPHARHVRFHAVKPKEFYGLLHRLYPNPLELAQPTWGVKEDGTDAASFINDLFCRCLRQGASDIHFEPTQRMVRVRVRLNGLLHPMTLFHTDFWTPVLTHLKLLAELDVAQDRLPQFGRFTKTIEGSTIDCRLSTHPTQQGESLVIRLLDQSRELYRLDRLGFSAPMTQNLAKLMTLPQGLIVVTGPTGSGKTTTLYALLSLLNPQEKKIVTLEDPIEYSLSHIQQTEIQEALGFGFAEGIRSLLRQDPDVILVGEIRDSETAMMAVRAALTGHLVLTTLHTPDALGALPRLRDLGVPMSHLAEVLKGVLAQRLIRKPCHECQEKGCHTCHFTGHEGRHAIGELIEFHSEIRDLVDQGAGRRSLYQRLKQQNQLFLHDEADLLVRQGVLGAGEVLRVLGYQDTHE